MVRLKVFDIQIQPFLYTSFQFLNGTIKWGTNKGAAILFQFLNGAIKGPASVCTFVLFAFHFNSSMVRLKAFCGKGGHIYDFDFNSSMVRLKGEVTTQINSLTKFQFLNGAIKGVIF